MRFEQSRVRLYILMSILLITILLPNASNTSNQYRILRHPSISFLDYANNRQKELHNKICAHEPEYANFSHTRTQEFSLDFSHTYTVPLKINILIFLKKPLGGHASAKPITPWSPNRKAQRT